MVGPVDVVLVVGGAVGGVRGCGSIELVES